MPESDVIATFPWQVAAECCPELFGPAWAELAYQFRDATKVRPFIDTITLHKNGDVTFSFSLFRLVRGKWKLTETGCTGLANPGRLFGNGREGARTTELVREYLERKKKEIEEHDRR